MDKESKCPQNLSLGTQGGMDHNLKISRSNFILTVTELNKTNGCFTIIHDFILQCLILIDTSHGNINLNIFSIKMVIYKGKHNLTMQTLDGANGFIQTNKFIFGFRLLSQ